MNQNPPDDAYESIETNIVDTVETVRLYEETIADLKTKHPEIPVELPSIRQAVRNAVQNPTHVEQSSGESFVFVDSETTNRSGDPLKVPVKLIEDTSARVRTVYFASSTAERNIVWRRTDD